MSQIYNLMKQASKQSLEITKNKVKPFRKNIVVIEEGWFSDMNLIDSEKFPLDLIKHAKFMFYKKRIFQISQSDTFFN